ncbi:MAG: cytochrome b/b6 domain-containing protein [Pseudomonadota bacterium]
MPYTTGQKILHWLTAFLVLGMTASGLAYSLEWADKSILQSHQISGQILIVVIALRIVARIAHRPSECESHAPWERRLASVIHLALYGLILVFIVSGYVSASALSNSALLFPVDLGFARSDTGEVFLEVHYAAKWALLALLALHFGGSLKHAFVDRDNSFSRMWFSSRKGT